MWLAHALVALTHATLALAAVLLGDGDNDEGVGGSLRLWL